MRKILLLIALCFPIAARAETITVSAAVSLKEAVTEIGKIYETQTGDHADFNFAASGPLAAQIEQGAPVDLFISAANKQVNELVKTGFADSTSRQVIVRNELVLIAPAFAQNALQSFADLANANVKKIALGQPQSVPAGQYATQTLAALNLSAAVTSKIVYGSSVRQVLDYVQRNEVDAGIVYSTDAKQAGDSVRVLATADAATHEPIEYPAVVISKSAHIQAARKFARFLASPPATAVFLARGFILPDSAPTTQPAP